LKQVSQSSKKKRLKKFLILILEDYGDPSLSIQHRLLVNIDDENDCASKFSQLNYQFRLSNLSPIGFLLVEFKQMMIMIIHLIFVVFNIKFYKTIIKMLLILIQIMEDWF